MRLSLLAALLLGVVPAAAAPLLPPPGPYDSQLGGAYPPTPGTQVVSRDREDPAAPGLYSICYINAFQTQPQDEAWWRDTHPDLLLTSHGRPVEDPNWPGEYLLDTTTASKRADLLDIVGGWIAGCARDGFQAIEADNLDTYSRSHGHISEADNLAFARDFVALAHDAGLAAAQKNGADLGTSGRAIGFDFAITESCAVYDECDAYADVFGPLVFDIEYSDTDGVEAACAASGNGANFSVILRDRNLTTPADPAYVLRAC